MIKRLVDKIREKAGSMIYVWAGGRPEWNDWPNDKSKIGSGATNTIYYTRAIQNIKNPEENCERIDESIRASLTGSLKNAPNASHSDLDFDLASYGTLIGEKQIAYEPVIVRARGIRGLFGGKETVYGQREVPGKPYKLSELVNANSNEEASFVRASLRVHLTDNGGRRALHPSLTVIGNKQLTDEVISYLMQNPTQYLELAKQIFPREKFPNINTGILGHVKNADSVVFLDADRVRESGEVHSSEYGENLEPQVYEKFGRRVRKA